MRATSYASTVRSWEPFEEFYRREYPAVLGLAFALTGNHWTAEELTQDAFLAAARAWDRMETIDQPGAWVRRVVSNMAVSSFRRRAAEVRALARIGRSRPAVVPDLNADDGEFWRVVRSLPRRQAQVVALFYLHDCSVSEVAEILDMAPGTVKKHLYDGRHALAQRLRYEVDD